ncbi:MAG TPA: transketolase C-terminal domain-containing protein [Acidimicrobiia bacterium]
MTLTKGKALRFVFGETVAELGETDPRIVVLDGDLGSSTGADIFEKAHPDRYFQMGIAEQNMLGVAAGMATIGFIPFVSTFACFAVARALDSIRVLIAQPRLNVKITGGYAGLLAGMTGKTHLMFDDVAVMRAMANMVTVAPADEVETRQAIRAIVAYDGPVYLRLTRSDSPILFDDSYRFVLGRSTVVRQGDDVTVFSTGVHTTRVFEAAQLLADDGIEVHLVHVPTIKPLDEEGIVTAAQKTGFVITAEEHSIIGGLGSAVAETLSDRYPVPVKRLGLADTFGESGPDDALLDKYGISVEKTTAAIKALVGARKGAKRN